MNDSNPQSTPESETTNSGQSSNPLDKVKDFLGFEDKVPLEEGIKKMIDWAKDQEVVEGEKFTNIEIEENLPDGWN